MAREHECHLRVHKLPRQVGEEALSGSVVVVIDALRATSTICQALASGAREVVPFLEVEEAVGAAGQAKRTGIVLGGERRGMRIEGFDLGNSPREYTRAAVGGRRVFISTTNGTRALHHARHGLRVVLASYLNLSAVAECVGKEPCIDILCAGTDGMETGEDNLAAGGIVHKLCTAFGRPDWRLNDAAATAGAQWSALEARAQVAGRALGTQLAIAMRDTPGGRNLIEIGLERDLADCAEVDRLAIVPEFDVRSWRITVR